MNKILKILLRIFAVFAFIVGFALIKESTGSAIILILASIFLFFYPSYYAKSKKKNRGRKKRKRTAQPQQRPLPPQEIFSFYVRGTWKNNDKGFPIQDILKEKMDYSDDPYGGFSPRDIREFLEDLPYEKLYRYDGAYINLNFEKFPNGVKVYTDNHVHVGYVPDEYEKLVLDHMDHKFDATIIGGEYKILEDDRIITDNEEYQIKVDFLDRKL